MKFIYKRVSESYLNEKEIEINSIEELMQFIEEHDENIIISKDKRILIYDDYIE